MSLSLGNQSSLAPHQQVAWNWYNFEGQRSSSSSLSKEGCSLCVGALLHSRHPQRGLKDDFGTRWRIEQFDNQTNKWLRKCHKIQQRGRINPRDLLGNKASSFWPSKKVGYRQMKSKFHSITSCLIFVVSFFTSD